MKEKATTMSPGSPEECYDPSTFALANASLARPTNNILEPGATIILLHLHSLRASHLRFVVLA